MALERLEAKLDKVVDSVASIDKTLAAQAVQLEEHIRRTAILEADIKPIKEHVQKLKGIAWFLGGLITAAEFYHAVWG